MTVAGLLADGAGYAQPNVWALTGMLAPTAGHPPLWPLVLAVPAALGLDTELAARLLGALVGTLTCVVAGRLGRRLAGPRTGLAAAALAAVYPGFVLADTSGMSESLYVLLVGLALLLAVRVAGRGENAGLGAPALLGACLGLAALTRTEGLLLVPLLAWPAVALGGRPRVASLAAVTLAAVLVVAPWTGRNAIRLHAFVPVATNDSAVYAGANCPQTYAGPDIGLWSSACVFAASGAVRPGAAYDEGALQSRWRAAGLRYAADHPGRLAAVVGVRVLRTWSLWQPRRQAQLEEGQNRRVAQLALPFFYVLVLLAGVGALRLRGRVPRAWLLLAAPVAVVTLTSALGWGFPRFRHPAELALVVLAGAALPAVRPTNREGRPTAPLAQPD